MLDANQTQDDFKYWAFISYSHKDEKWARWLHKKLETYNGHKKLVGDINLYDQPIPKRVFPVFRDREELPGAPDLAIQLNESLKQSRFLIVICSPHAAQSEYVNEEIRYFKSLKRGKYVLALIVDGEPHALISPDSKQEECFPNALKYTVDNNGQLTTQNTELIAADVRKNKDGKQNALLKILAGILGVGFDILKQRDQERRLRLYLMLGTASFTAMLLVLGLAMFAWSQRNDAIFQRSESESREYSALSMLAAETDVADALRHAIGAGKLSDNLQSRSALRKAIQWSHAEVILSHKDGTEDAVFANNTQYLISTNGDRLDIWDLETVKHTGILTTTNNKKTQEKGTFDLIKVSPDGKRVLSRIGNRICVWDIESKKEILSFTRSNVIRITHIDFSPDSKQLLEVSGASVLVHDLDNNKIIFDEAGTILTSAQISPDGKLIAASSSDARNTTIWNKETGVRLSYVSTKGAAKTVEFSPDSKWLMATTSSSIKLWNIEAPENPVLVNINQQLGPNESIFNCAHFSKNIDLLRLVTCGADGVVRVWKPEKNGQLKWSEEGALRGHQKAVLDANFDATTEKLISTSLDKTARIWIRNSFGKEAHSEWQQLSVLRGHRGAVNKAEFSEVGDRVVTRGQEGDIILWNTVLDREVAVLARSWGSVDTVFFDNKGERLAVKFDVNGLKTDLNPPDIWDPIHGKIITLGNTPYIYPVQFSPDDKSILVKGPKNNAALYDSLTGKVKQLFEGHTSSVTSAQFDKSGKYIISAAHDHLVKKWDADSGQVLTTFKGPDSSPEGTAVSSDGNKIASFWWNDEIWVWSDSGVIIAKIDRADKRRYLSAIIFNADGSELRIVAFYEVEIWNTLTWQPITKIVSKKLAHGRVLLALAEDYVIFSDSSGRIEVVFIESDRQSFTLEGHVSKISAADLNSDHTKLLTGDKNGVVRLWDINTGNLLEDIHHHKNEVVVVQFNKQGDKFVTGSKDGTVRVYYSQINDLIKLAEFRLPVLLQAK